MEIISKILANFNKQPFLGTVFVFFLFETVQNFLNFVNLRFSETVDENFKLFGLQY